MTFDEFLAKNDGVGVDFDKSYGYQCMDVAQQYVTDVLGNPPLKNTGSALSCWDNYDSNLYDRIANTQAGVPVKGDVCIWGTGVGKYGHIDIFISGDVNTFVGFDQNWPLNVDANGNGLGVAHKQNHNYNSILGWLHPKVSDAILVKKTDFENLVNKSGKFDAFVIAGFSDPQQIVDKIAQFNSENNSLSSQVNGLTQQIALLQGQQSDLEKQLTDTSTERNMWKGKAVDLQAKIDSMPPDATTISLIASLHPLVKNWLVYLGSRQKIKSLLGL